MKFAKLSALATLLALPIRAQDGKDLGSQSGLGTLGESRIQGVTFAFTKYRMEDLPTPVQKTVQEHSGGYRIAGIDRDERNGQTVWEVEFDREGRNPKIQIANDGRLLARREPGPLDK